MYRYDEYDQALVQARVEQFRDQVARRISGELSEEEFLPLRLQNGLYLQRHAYMLRVAIPYGTLSSAQLRTLARVADTYDGGMLLRVMVGGGLGRTPILNEAVREALPWRHLLTYVEAVLRVYNRYGRRDNKYKARIKILVKSLGVEAFAAEVERAGRRPIPARTRWPATPRWCCRPSRAMPLRPAM